MRIERRIRVCRTGVKDVTEREAMRLILEDGKKTCLYADEYSRWTRGLGMAGYMDLRSFCVQQGARDIREWLMARGLYRNVERDMRAGSGAIDPEGSAEAICARISKYGWFSKRVLNRCPTMPVAPTIPTRNLLMMLCFLYNFRIL